MHDACTMKVDTHNWRQRGNCFIGALEAGCSEGTTGVEVWGMLEEKEVHDFALRAQTCPFKIIPFYSSNLHSVDNLEPLCSRTTRNW